jgi:phenylpropionate dioxygenase-like ring-hydroxylating dioxygenase large terminal subunit
MERAGLRCEPWHQDDARRLPTRKDGLKVALTARGSAGSYAELAPGSTMPHDWYTDPAIYELERELIFRRSWHYACLASDVAEVGATYACSVADNVPIVVTRDKQGVLRAFINVCRHRGTVIVDDGPSTCASFKCPYHAWTYDLDGSLRTAPRSDRETSFDKSEWGLKPIRVDIAGPLVCVNLDEGAGPLAEWVGPLPGIMANSGVDFGSLERYEHTTWEVPVNWKIMLENALECYHCQGVHPTAAACYDLDAGRYAITNTGNVIDAAIKLIDQDKPNPEGAESPDWTGEVHDTGFTFLFPSSGFGFFSGRSNAQLYRFMPTSPKTTKVSFEYLFGADVSEQYKAEMKTFLDQVGDEDWTIIQRIQRGLECGSIEHGRLLQNSEAGIQQFANLVHGALS